MAAGIDIGSVTTEALLFDKEKGLVGYSILYTGADSGRTSELAFDKVLAGAGKARSDAVYVVATGCGRRRADFANDAVTEITCLAKGVNYLFPGARTIIDIGGQDTKVIKVDARGRVVEFEMNDKCAAGTGRFLEVMAGVFKVPLDQLGGLALQATDRIPMSSTCTVFVESETISLVARGEKPENILAGIHYAIAHRVAGLFSRVGIQTDVFFSGGVAKNTGMRKALEETMKVKIIEPTYDPQLTGALGAAVIAQTLGAKKEKAHELARA